MHIHGYSYWVLAAGNGDVLGPDGSLDASKVSLDLEAPPLRDNVAVPQAVSAPAPSPSSSAGMTRRLMAGGSMADMGSGSAAAAPSQLYGYSVVRLRADNPGIW